MLPRYAIPVIALWIIAVVLAFVPPVDFLGMSHHTYTGILFVAATVASVALFFKASNSAA
ncbi:MAG: hypothetical protein NVS3B25_33520 [Hymenobacter sp.]